MDTARPFSIFFGKARTSFSSVGGAGGRGVGAEDWDYHGYGAQPISRPRRDEKERASSQMTVKLPRPGQGRTGQGAGQGRAR